MKTTIKILLIALVSAGIAACIYFYTKNVEDAVQLELVAPKFDKAITMQCDRLVKGKQYPQVQPAFQQVMDAITTEAFIQNDKGENIISEGDKQAAIKVLIAEYTPAFTQYAKGYFNNSAWDDNTLAQLKAEANKLLGYNVIDNTTEHYSDCQFVVQTVDDFHAAWSVANSASHCSSVSGIDAISSKVNKYSHQPLTNNVSLKNALGQAVGKAKSAVANSIAGQINAVARKYASYGSYDYFINKKEAMEKLAYSYTSRYGSNSAISSALSSLRSAVDSAYDYYFF